MPEQELGDGHEVEKIGLTSMKANSIFKCPETHKRLELYERGSSEMTHCPFCGSQFDSKEDSP